MSKRFLSLLGIALIPILSGCDRDDDGGSSVIVVERDMNAGSGTIDIPIEPVSDWVDYQLIVSVQSHSGYALAGALIQVVVADGRPGIQGHADAWGRAAFAFTARPDSWVFVDACSDGFACAAVDIRTSASPQMELPISLPYLAGL